MGYRSVLNAALWLILLPLGVHAEPMEFTYEFYGTSAQQSWARGAVLTVRFDGTVQADNDTVTINSIESATLERLGMPVYSYPSVEAGEIGTVPAGGTPVVSFSGRTLNFTVCPSGFTTDSDGDQVLDNCAYETDGGFGMTYGLAESDGDWASAADDSGTATCADNPGCPATDAAVDVSAWLLDSDSDGDGRFDTADNCPDARNRNQGDLNGFADGDGHGDACEIGDTQSFSDGARPAVTPVYNAIPTSCAVNGWLVFDCAAAVVQGEGGAGDNALYFDSANAHNRHFNFLTWDEYPHADFRFLGDFIDAEVTALRFRARHAGGTEPLVLRVMVTDSFNDDGSDFAISLEAARIEVGSGWTQYEISLDQNDLELGTKIFGQPGIVAPRRTSDEILGAVAQFSLRHDPAFAGPGTPAPTDAAMEIDDIELVGGGSTGPVFLLGLVLVALRRAARSPGEAGR